MQFILQVRKQGARELSNLVIVTRPVERQDPKLLHVHFASVSGIAGLSSSPRVIREHTPCFVQNIASPKIHRLKS